MKFPITATSKWLGRLAPDRCGSVSLPAIFLFTLLLPAHAAHAAQEADPSQKLREQLRGVMLQLRTSQTDAANALAAQAAAEKKNADLTAKAADLEKRVAAQIKQNNSDKTASDESVAKLNNKLAEREKRIVEYTEALEKWQAGYQKAAEVARAKEDERAKLAAEAIVLKRTVADRESKNVALFNTSNEILDRYESYALGKAIGAREPFIGTTRVKIENQVQGYKDQILDNRISARKP
jgi:chromosome segregation ATPase